MRAMQAERRLWLEVAALLTAVALASMLVWPAHGQAPNAPPPGSPPCLPHQPPASAGKPPSTTGEAAGTATRPENLTDRLARADGVLCPPPNVDPEMKLPTPDTGNNMPVIPPPGSPGGDPDIRPK